MQVRDPADRLGAGPIGSEKDMRALRSHQFLSTISWDTLWVEPAPALEPGLVRREHPLAQDKYNNWEDIGATWDDLVADDGELEWAADATGPEVQLVRQNGFGHAVHETDSVDIGPMGEIRPRFIPRRDLDLSSPDSPSGNPFNPTTLPISIPASTGADTPSTASPASSGSSPVDAVMDRLTLQSSKISASDCHKELLDVIEAERGRNRALTPVQGNSLPSPIDL